VRIAEIYKSVQGEGFWTGTPSVFVRTSGCNLRCWFCDTPYTSWAPEGEDLSIDEILARCDTRASSEIAPPLDGPSDAPFPGGALDCRHVVVTGGEPMLLAELVPLTERLRDAKRIITIETAGTLHLPVTCDLMSISPKLAGSTPPAERDVGWSVRHERSRHVPHAIRRLTAEFPYQLKFVVDAPRDCDDVQRWLDEFPEIDRDRVMLMPQGTDAASLAERAAWLVPYCQRNGLRFCPRRHIEWFGWTRGT
jgi:7-carboxy-7-deazaguanine synthase